MGEWLPCVMESLRDYHMAHHDIPGGRFNVFFPVFDYLFGKMKPEIEQTEEHVMARQAVESNGSSGMLSSLLWSWMIGVALGIRYLRQPGRTN